MERWIRSGMVAFALFAGDGAGAEQYLVNAVAGNDGDGHVNNDDPDAFAQFDRTEPGGGFESYRAGADASTGSIYASAARTDPLPPAAISTSAGASIEETIHFDELPADSVTVRARLGVGLIATRNVGFAHANARLDLGGCYVTKGFNAVSGASSGGNCPGDGADTIEMTITRDQLIQIGGQLDISVNVSAQLESQGGIDGHAEVSGGIPLSRGAGPIPGQVSLELDPPLAISFTGSQTAFPVPEPAAPLLVAAGGLALLAARRSVASPRGR